MLIIQLEHLFVVPTTLKTMQKNLIILQQIYDMFNRFNYKFSSIKKLIVFEYWFMFLDEIIQIQQDIIRLKSSANAKCPTTGLGIDALCLKIKNLYKPKATYFKRCPIPTGSGAILRGATNWYHNPAKRDWATAKWYKPPHIQLCVDQIVYDLL
jgi:hypothetical protein